MWIQIRVFLYLFLAAFAWGRHESQLFVSFSMKEQVKYCCAGAADAETSWKSAFRGSIQSQAGGTVGFNHRPKKSSSSVGPEIRHEEFAQSQPQGLSPQELEWGRSGMQCSQGFGILRPSGALRLGSVCACAKCRYSSKKRFCLLAAMRCELLPLDLGL